MKCPHCGKAITMRAVRHRRKETTWGDVMKWGMNKGAKATSRKNGGRLATAGKR